MMFIPLPETHHGQQGKSTGSGVTDGGCQRHRPGGCHTDTCCCCCHHCRIELHSRSQQCLNDIAVAHYMSPFRKRRRHHVRGKSFPGDADSASSLRCNTITSRHASAAFSSNVLYTAGISCPPARTSSTVSCASVLKRSTFQQASPRGQHTAVGSADGYTHHAGTARQSGCGFPGRQTRTPGLCDKYSVPRCEAVCAPPPCR